MSAAGATVRARELYRFFHVGDDETLALRGVTLEVGAGEIVAVTGPSGSGKSTLLACLAGLDDPDGGAVAIAGDRLSRRPEPERAAARRARLGVLLQSGNLIEHLSVRDNVLLAQRLAGRVDRARADAVIETVGLTGRAGNRPSQLSRGEAARAGLAVAVANDPPVLLADEPTGELDGASEERVLALLRRLADGGTAVVVVTHSAAVARSADRTVELLDGKVLDRTSPERPVMEGAPS